MSVLDRLASPLKSRDAAVRLKAVQQHPADDTDTLAELVRRDPDPRVRREAVRRLDAPRVLLDLVNTAADEEARRLAQTRSEALLVKIAADDRDLDESRRALALLTPLPALAEVASRARFPEVRDEAFERVLASGTEDEARDAALATVAAKAGEPALRSRALDAVRTGDALVAVAVGAGTHETAPAAVRRLEDPDLLLAIARSGAPKSVRRLAQRRAEERLPDDHPERVAARQRELVELLDRAEQADPRNTGENEALLAAVEALAAAGPLDDAVRARVEALRERGRRVGLSAEDAARLTPPQAPPPKPVAAPPPKKPRPRAPARILELVTQLEDPDAGLGVPEVHALEVETEQLLVEAAEDAPLRARLEQAVKAARDRAFARKRQRIAEFQLGELADQAEALLKSLGPKGREGAARRELARLTKRFERSRRKPAGDAQEEATGEAARFQRVVAKIETALGARETKRDRSNRKFKERVAKLDARLEALESAESLSADDAEVALRDLGNLRNQAEVWRRVSPEQKSRFQRRQAALLPRLREAREIREWKRWSNLEDQAALIRRAKALAEIADDARVDRALAELERGWHQARHTAGDKGQELWEEWSAVRTQLLERVGPLREKAEQEMKEQLGRLASVASRAEEIAESGDPRRAAEMRALMDEWKQHAKGLRKRSESQWKRFRKANDEYFGALKEQRKERDAELAENIPRREELIARAKALLEESDPERVHGGVRGLMHEWKEARPVPKKVGDRLWSDFAGACDEARDRVRKADDAGADDESGSEAPGEDEAALTAAVAELAKSPASERPAAAESLWADYWRLRRASGGATARRRLDKAGDALTSTLRKAFEEAPDAFAGGRFDQDALEKKLAPLVESLDELEAQASAANARAPAKAGVTSLVEHLQRTLLAGRAADKDAPARDAAASAAQLLERARASGPALSKAAVKALAGIEKRAGKLIADAPAPPEAKERKPRRRGRFPDSRRGDSRPRR